MAQLVERTLGKGEVLSSILSISTMFEEASIISRLFFCFIIKASLLFLTAIYISGYGGYLTRV